MVQVAMECSRSETLALLRDILKGRDTLSLGLVTAFPRDQHVPRLVPRGQTTWVGQRKRGHSAEAQIPPSRPERIPATVDARL